MSISLYGPMRKYPRIEIDQKAYDGLQVEAVLRHRTTREIATQAILTSISREALSVLDHQTIGPETTSPKDIATKGPLDHRTTEGAAIERGEPGIAPKPRKLADNQTALKQIKDMWSSGEHNAAKIAKEIDYKRSTTWENIRKMKERGEISD